MGSLVPAIGASGFAAAASAMGSAAVSVAVAACFGGIVEVTLLTSSSKLLGFPEHFAELPKCSPVLQTLRLNNTRISECSVKNWSWIAETGRFDFMDILYI